MDSGAPSPHRASRPRAWFFLVVAALIAVGIIAPMTVRWYMHRTATTVPVDTTGNEPRDSLRLGTPTVLDSGAARPNSGKRP